MNLFCKSVLISAVLIVFSVGSAAAYLETGSSAPDFEATDLDGGKVRLSDYKGQIIILKLGTTWCPDCVGMTTDLAADGTFLKDNGVVVVDVFIQETAKTVSEYLKGKDFVTRFVPVLDNGQAHKAYQVYLIPRVVVIDQDFKIVHDGLRLSPAKLREKITSLAMSTVKSRGPETGEGN